MIPILVIRTDRCSLSGGLGPSGSSQASKKRTRGLHLDPRRMVFPVEFVASGQCVPCLGQVM